MADTTFYRTKTLLERARDATVKTAMTVTLTSATTRTIDVGIVLIKEILTSIKVNTGNATRIIALPSGTAKSVDITAIGSNNLVDVYLNVEGIGRR